jgi:hypothetical protein
LAPLAEQLGLRFEAKVYMTIAALVKPRRRAPRSELARLKARGIVEAGFGLTQADFLAFERDARPTEIGELLGAAGTTTRAPTAR